MGSINILTMRRFGWTLLVIIPFMVMTIIYWLIKIFIFTRTLIIKKS